MKYLVIIIALHINSFYSQNLHGIVETNKSKIPSTYSNFRRFVFSEKGFTISFQIPLELNGFNNDVNIEKFNHEYGFNFTLSSFERYIDELFFIDSTGRNLLIVNANFSFMSNNLRIEDYIFNSDNDSSLIFKSYYLWISTMNCEIEKINLGPFKLPFFYFVRDNFQFPFTIYSGLIKQKFSNKKLCFSQATVSLNHLMSLSFNFYGVKPILASNYTFQQIVKSVRLHKLDLNNTSIFDDFDNNSGFIDGVD